jgi:predicted ArsR family transcriptional regulator
MIGFKNPDLGRQAVRHRMKKLVAEGIVKAKRKPVKTAAGKTYRLKVYSLAEVRV